MADGLPELPSDSDSDGGLAHKFSSVVGQVCPIPKKKRKDLPERRRIWLNARDRLMEDAEHETFKRDKGILRVPTISLKDIKYADTPDAADALMSTLIEEMRAARNVHFFFGVDTEGAKLEVLQIFTRLNCNKYAYILQLNKISSGGELPSKLKEFFMFPNIVLIGKNVEGEMVTLLRKYGFPDERITSLFFIDILTLVQVCDVFSRDDLDDALQFSKDGTFSFSLEVPDEAVPTVYEDAGVRAVGAYFRDYVIDKRVHHVHPNRVDWSCSTNHRYTKNRMSDTMRRYAMTDAVVPYEAAFRVVDMTGIGRADLIKVARLAPSRAPAPFFSDHLYKFFEELAVRGVDNCGVREKVDAARENHERKMVLETRRRKFRHDHYITHRDKWRKDNDYDPLPDDDPFKRNGRFFKLFRKAFVPTDDPLVRLSDIKPAG